MEKVMDFLWDTWDSEGIVPELHAIEEELEEVITHDEALDIPNIVERFISLIRPREGVILYELPKAVTTRV
jgi:hypothetical protein